MKHENHMIYSEHGGSRIVSLMFSSMFSKVKTKPFFSLKSKHRNYKKNTNINNININLKSCRNSNIKISLNICQINSITCLDVRLDISSKI